jgi:CBS domain-containing protein
MKSKDVMTEKVVFCYPEDKVAKAAKKMKKADIGSLPIVDNKENKKLTGIVTDRDLALKVIGKGRNPKSTKIKKVMTKDVVTCRTTDEVQKVMNLMAEHQLRRIPVVDKDNRVVGVIAQADVATRLDQPNQTAAMVKNISLSNQ